MRSVKSCFNATLLKKNFARFWPIWGLYAVIWFFLLPVNVLTSGRHWNAGYARSLPLAFLDDGGVGLPLAVVFGVLSAMAVFAYLYNSRSVGLMHALPMRREGLFLTSYLSGLGFLLLPNAAIFLITLAAEALAGTVVFSSLFLWLVVQCLLCFFFYSFAVFCAMFTGHILALPAFYVILNGLAAGLAFLFGSMAGAFLFGYAGSGGLAEAACWLTPIWRLMASMSVIYDSPDHPGSGGVEYAHFTGLLVVLLYALVGLVLVILALAAYRRRQLESAGDIVSVSWVRPVFKYGVAACCSVALGLFLYSIFHYSLPDSAWVLLGFMLLSGAIGYFIAEMLLRKRFWVFRQSWKGCLVLLVCVAAAICALEFDVTGFERRVPALEQVESVTISQVNSAPRDGANYSTYVISDGEGLAQALALHEAVAAEKPAIEDNAYDWLSETRDGLDVQTSGGTDLRIRYELKGGGYLERRYSLPVTEEALARPDSYAAQLSRLINRPALLEDAYFRGVVENHRLVDVTVAQTYNEAQGVFEDVSLSAADGDEIFAAVRSDLEAGRLHRYLLDDKERLENCYLSDLVLTFYAPEPGQTDATLNTALNAAASTDVSYTYSVTIGLEASATDTLAALERAGLTNTLITHAAYAGSSADYYSEDAETVYAEVRGN